MAICAFGSFGMLSVSMLRHRMLHNAHSAQCDDRVYTLIPARHGQGTPPTVPARGLARNQASTSPSHSHASLTISYIA